MAAAKDEDPGNPTINFRGEKRRNDTHQSTTDPESMLYRKAGGKEARLCFGAHALMENRNGLCADFTLHNQIAESEPVVALQQADAHQQLYRDLKVKTLGADKGYHQKDFVQGCRARAIVPHVACKERVKVAGLDGRTTTQRSYQVSLKIRKRVEEIFGWIKTLGGFRRSRYRGVERTQAWGYFVAGTYNLLRMAPLGGGARAGGDGAKSPARAERAAVRESTGRISAAVGTALTAVPMLDFENFTHGKLR